ncbi:MAG: primosomal protein N' [Bacteroidales bacterium]|nr:primosomal protein N' [Bacteroidales bacterium]
MDKLRYILVILPVRLGWEPCYSTRLKDLEVGTRVRVKLAGREYVGVVSAVDVPPQTAVSKIMAIEGVEEGLDKVSTEEIALWRQVASYYLCTIGEVYKAAYPSSRTITELKKPRKAKAKETREETAPELSEAQKKALSEIREAFSRQSTVLLHGVTGSGKTLLYNILAKEMLEQGRSVLYLVPEIALSRQLEQRLALVFGEKLCVYHSAETPARKRNIVKAAREGGHIILGTRSAVFLPFRNLGLVTVDEEHDSSYKQDAPAPRYNGRDTALMLASIHRCNAILGSATPSLGCLLNCECGKWTMVRLEEKFHGSVPARVEIIDTIAERRKRGMVGSFSRKLIGHMEETLAEGGQVLILRSRRAYSPAVQCSGCGTIPKCPHCNISLSYHKAALRLACHHCGYSITYSGTCPECSGSYGTLGAGTQKIAEEAEALFPQAKVGRLDSDSALDPRQEAMIIKDFEEGRTDILVGTQMIAKGFDFDRLRLVVMMNADSLTGMQDFRADEKAFQLMEQFRGRSGRRGQESLFVIQTSRPSHPVYTALGDPAFSMQLLEERLFFGLPPYRRIAEVCVRDIVEERGRRHASELASLLISSLHASMDSPLVPVTPATAEPVVSCPYVPAPAKVADEYLFMIRVSFRKDAALQAHKSRLLETVSTFEAQMKGSGSVTIDVDPV